MKTGHRELKAGHLGAKPASTDQNSQAEIAAELQIVGTIRDSLRSASGIKAKRFKEIDSVRRIRLDSDRPGAAICGPSPVLQDSPG
jgi:hypothetical protein